MNGNESAFALVTPGNTTAAGAPRRRRLSEKRVVPAGLYWVRLTQGADRRSVRVSVIE